jgi:hypothetical protein
MNGNNANQRQGVDAVFATADYLESKGSRKSRSVELTGFGNTRIDFPGNQRDFLFQYEYYGETG